MKTIYLKQKSVVISKLFPRCFGLIIAFGVTFVGVMPISGQDAESSPDKRLRSAAFSFHEAMHEPDKGIPRDLFDKSRCIVIIPGVKKAAFLVGGKYGRGFVSCRRK